MYSIFIKIEAIEKRKRSAAVLHVVIGFFLLLKGADYYRLSGFKNPITLLPLFLIAFSSLGYGFFRNKFDKEGNNNQPLRLVQAIQFAALGFMLLKYAGAIDYVGSFVWSGLCFTLLLTERKIFKDTLLLIEDKGITVPGSFRDHFIRWNELADIVIRQDYITLFHANNKYLQFQVVQHLSELEVVQLNGFCKEQLTSTAAANSNH